MYSVNSSQLSESQKRIESRKEYSKRKVVALNPIVSCLTVPLPLTGTSNDTDFLFNWPQLGLSKVLLQTEDTIHPAIFSFILGVHNILAPYQLSAEIDN